MRIVIAPTSNGLGVGHIVVADQVSRGVDETSIVQQSVRMKGKRHPCRSQVRQLRSQHIPKHCCVMVRWG